MGKTPRMNFPAFSLVNIFRDKGYITKAMKSSVVITVNAYIPSDANIPLSPDMSVIMPAMSAKTPTGAYSIMKSTILSITALVASITGISGPAVFSPNNTMAMPTSIATRIICSIAELLLPAASRFSGTISTMKLSGPVSFILAAFSMLPASFSLYCC